MKTNPLQMGATSLLRALLYKLRGASVAFPLALAVVLSGCTTLSSAETILIDDFNDGNDDGWTRSDSNLFGQPWGPGVFDASSGAYHLGTTDKVLKHREKTGAPSLPSWQRSMGSPQALRHVLR